MSENKRAIVTGGTRGIGRAIVKELATKTCCGVLFSDVAFIYNSCDECVDELRKEIRMPRFMPLKPMRHLTRKLWIRLRWR